MGDRWDNDVAHKIQVPIEGQFVGEIPFDGTNYKFYQHRKIGLDVFSSNLWWDKAERSVNDYIVSQITLNAGELWISYEFGKKLLPFEIKDNTVVKITMNYDN